MLLEKHGRGAPIECAHTKVNGVGTFTLKSNLYHSGFARDKREVGTVSHSDSISCPRSLFEENRPWAYL